MEAGNSQSDARGRAGGSIALNLVRTLTIFMALAALSFVLGFFVLARLIPGTPKPAPAGGAATTNGQDNLADRSIPPVRTPATPLAPKPALIASNLPVQPVVAPGPKVVVTPGPSLDPVNDTAGKKPAVQRPHRLETVGARTPSPQSEDGSATTTGAKKPAPAKVAPPEDAPPVARPRKHKTTRPKTVDISDTGDAGDNAPEATTRRIQIPHKVKPRPADTSNDNGDQGDFVPSKAKMKVRDTEPTGSGLFHVHLGAFHSRDAAASEVERARAKGFTTQIVPVTRNGRTLYRVQAGAFRDRGHAESVQQSLQDANLDARITDQQR